MREKASEEDMDTLASAISGGSAGRASNNVAELVRYSLIDRSTPGINEDLYYTLKKRGRRYTVVEPGQEWIVVLSSLLAREPGQSSRVADLLQALECLGIGAGHRTVIGELEKVGLARTSHDADDAIEVKAAF